MLQAPFPYFGGKSRVAEEVWTALGDVRNYVEPFAGSLAVLLARPAPPQIETVNDLDGFVANFWRSVRRSPTKTARWADSPVNENDLHARHAWLVARKDTLRPKLEGDPEWHDPKIAGWWAWGMSAWIGSGFCSGKGPWAVRDRQLVHLGDAGRGVHRKLVHLGDAGRGVHRKLVHLGDAGRGLSGLHAWFASLSERLRHVRVCSGDWSRVCGPTVTHKHGLTGVFLDPPYQFSERAGDLYAHDHDVFRDVLAWARANGRNANMRIVLCGYDDGSVNLRGWRSFRWKAKGGYGSQGNGRGRENAHRETLWLSPHCLHLPYARKIAA